MPKTAFYAVKSGRKACIYDSWTECEAQVKGWPGAIFKKFPTQAAAQAFIGSPPTAAKARVIPPPTAAPYSLAIFAPKPLKSIATTEWAKDYYGVKLGRRPGVYTDWADAESQVRGIQGAAYKSFPTRAAAEAYIAGGETKAVKRPTAARSEWSAPISLSSDQKRTPTSSTSTTAAGITVALSPELQELGRKARKQGFTVTNEGSLVVYTDGSAWGNGKKGAKAGSGVWWGSSGQAKDLNTAERLPGPLQTNNRAELIAIIRALELCPFPDLPLEVRTDSQYSISCFTQWIPAWIRNSFRSSTGGEVKNQDMIVHLVALLNLRGKENGVRFVKVRAHRGEVGNEAADVLANTASGMPPVPDRTNWFTLDDASRHTVERQCRRSTIATKARMSGTSSADVIFVD